MNRQSIRLLLVAVFWLALPCLAPAPLIFRPGEGWTYEPVGGEGKWMQGNAKDQLGVAQAAFDKKAYSLALKAARHVIQKWGLSDYAPQAQYLLARCYEATGDDAQAFKSYQMLLEKYPKMANYDEILQHQYQIANRYLAGQWFKWGFLPLPPWISGQNERTAEMYDKIVKNGPYSDVGPQAQLKIGATREKQSNYPLAIKAYETAADRYHDRPEVATEALYRAASACKKEAQTAEYDQTVAGQSIAMYNDFMALYPKDSRVPEAQQFIVTLKREQARSSYEIAKFYDKRKHWNGALVYYNEVLVQDPNSPYAAEARQRLEELKRRTPKAAP